MSWAKIDDRANEHRKLLDAGAEACWLWTCGLMYANRQPARDGRIPARMLPMLYPFPPARIPKLSAKLVEVGLWVRTDDGFEIHQFRQWNKTKEQLDSEREATRLRVAEHRRRNGKGNADGNEESNGVTPTDVPDPLRSPTTTLPLGDPVRAAGAEPPALVLESPAAGAARTKSRRWSRVPKDWQPKPDHAGLAMDLGVPLDEEAAKFRDHEFRTPKSDADAAFRNWLRESLNRRRAAIAARPIGGSPRAADQLERQLARSQSLKDLERNGEAQPAQPKALA